MDVLLNALGIIKSSFVWWLSGGLSFILLIIIIAHKKEIKEDDEFSFVLFLFVLSVLIFILSSVLNIIEAGGIMEIISKIP